jgi:hypothetical protein
MVENLNSRVGMQMLSLLLGWVCEACLWPACMSLNCCIWSVLVNPQVTKVIREANGRAVCIL